jgi:heterodisulfide reductase subunit A-like polyferredoxin
VGAAAAARTIAWLGRHGRRQGRRQGRQINSWCRNQHHFGPLPLTVDPVYCRACSTCVEICEFGAPQIVGEFPLVTAWIDPDICTGCGVCAVHCPSGAILPICSSDVQIEAMLDALLEQP